MARIALITAQTALVLLVSISAGAHGTERHYGDPFGTVSYTHLTLPTIYSV